MKGLKIMIFLLLISIGCQPKKEIPKVMNPNKIEKKASKIKNIEEKRFFFKKNEITITDTKNMLVSNSNEVILFRPTEFNFGQLLEDTQSDDLVKLDGDFEELTNTIIDTFKENKNIKITVCEKPYVAIYQANDTLYLDAKKHLYGIIFNKKGEQPIFKNTTDQNIILQIKTHYNL